MIKVYFELEEEVKHIQLSGETEMGRATCKAYGIKTSKQYYKYKVCKSDIGSHRVSVNDSRYHNYKDKSLFSKSDASGLKYYMCGIFSLNFLECAVVSEYADNTIANIYFSISTDYDGVSTDIEKQQKWASLNSGTIKYMGQRAEMIYKTIEFKKN